MKANKLYLVWDFTFLIGLSFLVFQCAPPPSIHMSDKLYDQYKDYKWRAITVDNSLNLHDTSVVTRVNYERIPSKWWHIFKDPILDSLEDIALGNNRDIRGSVARQDEWKALVRVAWADLFPSIRLEPQFTVNRLSANRPNPFNPTVATLPVATISTYQFPFTFSYEIDVWGKYRSNIESASFSYHASEADKKAMELSVTGDVASNYFLLRTQDMQISLFKKAIDTRNVSFKLNQERYRVGLTTLLDVTQAESNLQLIQSQLFDLIRMREQTLHALAVLCGFPAFGFTIKPVERPLVIPEIPIGIPSDLLKRRPDLLRQEWLAKSQNAQIGSYLASRFPSVMLSGSGGTLSKDAATLFSPQSATWLLGAGISLPIFQGGRISANVQAAKARYEQSVASYEKSVMTAFQETEDALTNLEVFQQQSQIQQNLIKVTDQTAQLSRERYNRGFITYFEVVNNEQLALNAQTTGVQITGQNLINTIILIKALGGEWDNAEFSK